MAPPSVVLITFPPEAFLPAAYPVISSKNFTSTKAVPYADISVEVQFTPLSVDLIKVAGSENNPTPYTVDDPTVLIPQIPAGFGVILVTSDQVSPPSVVLKNFP